MNAITPPPEDGGRIVDEPLSEALSRRYLAYALSTIMGRALPDVRDGLKPVHRRLLYAMRVLRLDPTTTAKKCARVVGDVIGKYHPHGDTAVYEALVRLAQDFSQRYPLIDGQGNFGNIDGDNAAAMRYTEARLTEVAQALLAGINEDAVDFRPNFDGAERELLLPREDQRRRLWTSRVWPGALLVEGEICGTWRRARHTVRIELWARLSRAARDAVEAEARGLPLPGLDREIEVVWDV